MQIVISDEANDDLRAIDLYLSERNLRAADDFALLIISKLDGLKHFPHTGRRRSDLFPSLRSLVAGNHLIFYFVDPDCVTIARVIDGRRDIDAEFSS